MSTEPTSQSAAPMGLTTTPKAPEPTATTPPTTDPASTPPSTPESPKPEEPKAPEPAKPESPEAPAPLTAADLKLPEGFTLDEKASGDFLALMNDANLKPAERAQKLLDMQIAREQALSEQGTKAWDEMQEKWKAEIEKDPEIGGSKLEETTANIARFLDKYKADAETRQAFTLTGAGNNPHIVRFFNRVAKDVVEPGPVSGSPGTSGESLAAKLYTKMGK